MTKSGGVHSSLAIILKRKRKLVALLLLSYRCIVTITVLWLFLTVQCVIVDFVVIILIYSLEIKFY